MKVVILAGGRGTRLAEETELRPKPMVEIGGQPILWHIIKHFAHYEFTEFFIALGYKGEVIKRFFIDYHTHNSNLMIDLATGKLSLYESEREDWLIHLIDTGINTLTGGRVKRLEPWLKDEAFMVTYGDGVCNLDIHALIDFHRSHGKLATITAVRPPARFGGIIFDGDLVAEFTEKSQIGEGWINGGYMILEPAIFDYLEGDMTSLETPVLEQLAMQNQLAAYKHDGFWQCMDTIRDKNRLQELWQTGNAPWKTW